MAPKQRARAAQAAVLTAIALVLVFAMEMAFGRMGLVLSSITLPVALVLLWLSADVLRADECEVHAARARSRAAGSP